VPGKHFDVHTFEVKTFDQLDVTAVYEALAHRRAAHYSYVIVYQPTEQADDSILEDIAMEADHHEIGLIKIVDAADYNTWDAIVEPIRNDADPADLNDFLAAQTSNEFKDQITHWCR
jgi:hypothetical protein